MNPLMNRHLTDSYQLAHLARSQTLTFEQDHLAAPPQSITGAVALTLLKRRSCGGAQLDNGDSRHESQSNLFLSNYLHKGAKEDKGK